MGGKVNDVNGELIAVNTEPLISVYMFSSFDLKIHLVPAEILSGWNDNISREKVENK